MKRPAAQAGRIETSRARGNLPRKKGEKSKTSLPTLPPEKPSLWEEWNLQKPIHLTFGDRDIVSHGDVVQAAPLVWSQEKGLADLGSMKMKVTGKLEDHGDLTLQVQVVECQKEDSISYLMGDPPLIRWLHLCPQVKCPHLCAGNADLHAYQVMKTSMPELPLQAPLKGEETFPPPMPFLNSLPSVGGPENATGLHQLAKQMGFQLEDGSAQLPPAAPSLPIQPILGEASPEPIPNNHVISRREDFVKQLQINFNKTQMGGDKPSSAITNTPEVPGGSSLQLGKSKKKKVKKKKKKKRGKKHSSSGSSDSSSSETSSLDLEKNKFRDVAQKRPGALSLLALKEVSKIVDMEQGLTPSSTTILRPAFVRYYHTHLARMNLGPRAEREFLTLASIVDSLIQGKAPEAMDIAVQRLKAVESAATGTLPWEVAAQMELTELRKPSTISRREQELAAREQLKDLKVRQLLSRNEKGGRDRSHSPHRGAGTTVPPGILLPPTDRSGNDPHPNHFKRNNEKRVTFVDSPRRPFPPWKGGKGMGERKILTWENILHLGQDVSGMSLAAIGMVLKAHVLLKAPSGLQMFALTLRRLLPGSRDGRRFTDVLPVPVSSTSVAMEFVFQHETSLTQPKHPDIFLEGGLDCWVFCALVALNYLYCHRDATHVKKMPSIDITSHQHDLVTNVRSLIKDFISCEVRCPNHVWPSFFKSKQVSYSGEEVHVAHSFCWKNISLALPDKSMIGHAKAVELCDGGVREYLLNEDLMLLPPNEWPQSPAQAKVFVLDEEWPTVCKGLLEVGIARVLHESEVFSHNGTIMLNGMFGVEKGEIVNDIPVYRLIMNLIPFNEFCSPTMGDVALLPFIQQWGVFELLDGHIFLTSSEDLRCMFYLFEMPCHTHKFMAFNKPVPQDLHPDDRPGSFYLASRVLGMGWSSSVGIAQHIHRRLLGGLFPDLCLPLDKEVKKNQAVALPDPEPEHFWQVYLDNFDELVMGPSEKLQGLVGQPSPWQLMAREAYARSGLPRHPKKEVCQQIFGLCQGAQLQGDTGIMRPAPEKLLGYIGAALFLISKERSSLKDLQIVMGRLMYCCQFRRPMMSVFKWVWRHMTLLDKSFKHEPGWTPPPVPPRVLDELLMGLCLLPFAQLRMRRQHSHIVSCSDASGTGGGACVSTHLTGKGRMASSLNYLSQDLTKQDCRIMLVSLFDGIGAARYSLQMAGVSPFAYVSVEANRDCQRVVKSHFPAVDCIEDVTLINLTMVRQWARNYPTVTHVLVVGGPPVWGSQALSPRG